MIKAATNTTRDKIIHAALEIIADNGFHGSPVSMIAQKAEVGAGTIYVHFENKDELINEIYKELEKRTMSFILEGYVESRPLRERFLHLAKALVRFLIDHPLEYKFLEQFHNSPFGIVVRRDKFIESSPYVDRSNIFKALFEEAREQQVAKILPLPVLFALAFGPLFDVCRDHIVGLIELDLTLINQTAEACWDAVTL